MATTRRKTARGFSRSLRDTRLAPFRTTLEARGRTRRSSGFNRPAEDYSGRVDWQRDQDSITGRYQYTHQIFDTDDVIQGEVAKQDHRQQNLGFTWTRVFSTTWSERRATAWASGTRT